MINWSRCLHWKTWVSANIAAISFKIARNGLRLIKDEYVVIQMNNDGLVKVGNPKKIWGDLPWKYSQRWIQHKTQHLNKMQEARKHGSDFCRTRRQQMRTSNGNCLFCWCLEAIHLTGATLKRVDASHRAIKVYSDCIPNSGRPTGHRIV